MKNVVREILALAVAIAFLSPRVGAETGSSTGDGTIACGQKLLGEVGRTTPEAMALPLLYQKHSVSRDSEFVKYLYAVIYVESHFNKRALSPQQAYGLMQLTDGAVRDAVEHCGLRPVPDMEHLFDSVTNIRYGTCYLKKLLDDTEGDWTRTLILYNGGYKALTRYDRGDTINYETANYVLLVERARRICTNPTKGNE